MVQVFPRGCRARVADRGAFAAAWAWALVGKVELRVPLAIPYEVTTNCRTLLGEHKPQGTEKSRRDTGMLKTFEMAVKRRMVLMEVSCGRPEGPWVDGGLKG